MTVWAGLIALGLGLGASLFLPVPQNLKTSFDAGQSLYALGEFEGAIIEYSKIVKFDSKAVRTDSVRVVFGNDLELPVVAAAWYQLGNAYKKSGQHEEAVEAYRQVLDVGSVAEDFKSLVQFQVAETRFLAKEYGEAAKEYKHYVELFPETLEAGKAYFYAGWSEFNTKEYDQSIETLNGMLAAYPQDRYAPDSQFRIASSFYEKGEYAKAVEMAKTVLDKYPNSPVIAQALYLEANAYDQMGRDEEAIKAYRDVRNLYDRMFELLRGSFREGKNVDFENYRQLFETSSLRVAEIFRKTDQFEEAYQELIAAQETAEERFYKAKVQMRIGDNYMEWEKFNEAWTAYNQVIELYGDTPYPPNAQYQKGEAKYFAGDYAAAREDYLQLLGDYPDSDTGLRSASLYSAGWSAEKLGVVDQAIASYTQSVDNFPRSDQAPLCLLRIARLNYEQQKVQEAIEAYRAITESYQDTRHTADAYYGLGILYRDEDRKDEAIAAFSKVDRDARETYIAALIEAANLYISQDRITEGRALLNQLLEGVTGDRDLESRAHFQMAQLDLNNKNYVDAVERYTMVLEEYPESDVIRDTRYGRALAYHYSGRYDRALLDYKWLLDTKIPKAMQLKVSFSMALSYSAEGKDAEAEKLLNEVIASGDESLVRSARLQLISMAEKKGNPEEAVRIYEEMLATTTSSEDRERLLIRLANAYFKLDKFQQSIEAAQQLIDLAINVESIANALFVQGNCFYRSEQFVQAIATYNTIIENYPQIAWAKNAQFQIGVAYNKLSANGNVDVLPAMSQAFNTYYTQYPDDERAVHAYYYDAWAHYRMGKWRDASDIFASLADKYSQSRYASEALFRAGDALFNMTNRSGVENKNQHYLDAMVYYDRIIRRYPQSSHMDDALYNKAWCLINLDRKEEAVPIFERIVAEHPNGTYGARSQFTLGDYYYGLKDYEKATESYQTFLDRFPADKLTAQDRALPNKARTLLGHLAEIDAYNLYATGEQLLAEKNYDEAMVVFKEVQQKYPKSDQAVNSLVNIGAAYMAQEEFRQAGAVFQEVVDNYGDNPKYVTQVDYAREQLQVMQEARVL
ncbi:MAG: tetratricopeptide repeat protein [Gemmatimonadetes bacterium]|nr:tetratricopeptide repeat protein [Gemmatimonadota bacterium]MYB72280.1 tetratricopeptide repeat protein [Gemmatimonadota bacterium]